MFLAGVVMCLFRTCIRYILWFVDVSGATMVADTNTIEKIVYMISISCILNGRPPKNERTISPHVNLRNLNFLADLKSFGHEINPYLKKKRKKTEANKK
jgi:hypothetical protein